MEFPNSLEADREVVEEKYVLTPADLPEKKYQNVQTDDDGDRVGFSGVSTIPAGTHIIPL